MGFLDAAVSTGAKLAINNLLDDLGKVATLQLDLKQKTVAASVELAGETVPVEFQVGQYEIQREGDDVYLKMRDITCSREWLQKAIQKYQPEPRVKLPEKLAQAVKFAGMA